MLSRVTDEDEVAVAQSLVIEKKLKGIIFLGGNFDHGESALKQLGVPIVFSTVGADRLDTGNVRCAHVCINDVESGWLATDYLLGLGHRRIAIITEGLQVPSVGRMRTLGYRRALEEHGIPYRPELVFEVKDGAEHYTLPNGYKAASELLDSGEKVDAIFCISDVLAIGACRAIQDRGLKIPERFGRLRRRVSGFSSICWMAVPARTARWTQRSCSGSRQENETHDSLRQSLTIENE